MWCSSGGSSSWGSHWIDEAKGEQCVGILAADLGREGERKTRVGGIGEESGKYSASSRGL